MYLFDMYKRHLCCITLFPLRNIYKTAKMPSPIMSKRMLEVAGRSKLLYYLVILLVKKKNSAPFLKISTPSSTALASFE